MSVVAPHLRAVATRATSPLSDRIRALQTEARGLAREHIAALETALRAVEDLSADVATGGDAYPAGVRDLARRIAEDCGQKVQTLQALSGRQP